MAAKLVAVVPGPRRAVKDRVAELNRRSGLMRPGGNRPLLLLHWLGLKLVEGQAYRLRGSGISRGAIR